MPFRFPGRDYTAFFRQRGAVPCRPESVCACTGLLFFLPLVSLPESRFGRFWANQGLLILLIHIACLLLWLVGGGLLFLLGQIPLVGGFFRLLRLLVGTLCVLTALFYTVFPMTFAARGRAKEIPFFGSLRLIR